MDHRLGDLIGRWLVSGAVGLAVGYYVGQGRPARQRLGPVAARMQVQLENTKRTNAGTASQVTVPAIFRREAQPGVGPQFADGSKYLEGVTAEDVELASALQERRRRGDYLLHYEDPVGKKVNESVCKSMAANYAAKNAAELGRIFDGLGLQPEASRQLQYHQQKIAQAAIEASSALAQLSKARSDYDDRVRSSLSEENYAKYRQYEASRPAQEEYGLLEAYAQKRGVQIDPTYKEVVTGLIQQAGAYTANSAIRPYESVPEPAMGDQACISAAERDMRRIGEHAQQLAGSSAAAGLPEAYRELLTSYYAKGIADRQSFVNSIKDGSIREPGPEVRALEAAARARQRAGKAPVP